MRPGEPTGPMRELPALVARLCGGLSRRRRIQFGLLLLLMAVSAMAEVVSLGAVLPFLGILTAPERVFAYPLVARAAHAAGIVSADRLVLPLTVAFVGAVLAAALIRMMLLWATTRLTTAVGADLSIEVYRRTLYQPYAVHVARNSSTVIAGITNKINGVVFGVLLSCLFLISSSIMLAAVMFALVAIDPAVAVAALLAFGVSYVLIARFARQGLRRNGQFIASGEPRVLKALQEGLGGIRDVLLDGTQSVFCDIYRQADFPLRKAFGNNVVVGQSPRHLMEALGIVLIVSLAYGLSRQAGGLSKALPVLGALALGAQRLIPAMQQIYNAWAGMVGNQASLAEIVALLEQPLPAEVLLPPPSPLALSESIRFHEVRFQYSEDGAWVLDGLSMTISKGARVGFVGRTGCGKSTALDLLMGLLTPTSGEILVDGGPLRGPRVRAWQRTIAHVPQNIYLADTTVAENIAFGVAPELIDLGRVRQAAHQAQISQFVESRPEGYDALIGEHGIRLSGGQRQRIGIARALYKQASVLVFDEATSALDSDTEESVMDAIEGLNRELTILIIAHRLNTVRRCDTIIELKHGKAAVQGTYQQMFSSLDGRGAA